MDMKKVCCKSVNIMSSHFCKEDNCCTSLQKSIKSFTEEEKVGINHMFEMMMAARQQILLRKAMLNKEK